MLAGKAPSANLAQGQNGTTRDKVNAHVRGFLNRGRTTLAKAEELVAAAEAEPEKFGKLVEDMDRTGRVNAPYQRLKVIRQPIQIRAEPPPLPDRGPYRVIVCDPPWPYAVHGGPVASRRASLPDDVD